VPTASSTFDGGLNSVRDARRFLSSVLREWDTDAYDFGAPQVLSELATNAALHARTSFTVTVHLADECLLLEVSDASARVPRARHYAPDATTGRGMGLVAALSLSWGTTGAAGGKTVWARVAPDGSMFRDLYLEDLDDLEELGAVGDLGMAGGPLETRRPRQASRLTGRSNRHEARAS
jgi:anti-sigma regulatory factor (Ser/Thr protein kinase)